VEKLEAFVATKSPALVKGLVRYGETVKIMPMVDW